MSGWMDPQSGQQAADRSLKFGLFDHDQIMRGYGRAVTDYTHFALLDDVFIEPNSRGLGYGLVLAQGMVDALAPYGLRRIMLATREAHGLHQKVGFKQLPGPDHWMVLQPESTPAATRCADVE